MNVEKFDNLEKLKKYNQNIKIGELTQKTIEILELDYKPQNIYLWGPRIEEHCEKHKKEYLSEKNFYEAVQNIPEIIKNPDYVGIHTKNGNVQFIKELSEISLVGVKVMHGNKGLIFRTIFPLTRDKVEHNIRMGAYKEFK